MSEDSNWAKGRIAFITGATSGFGAALARRIIKAGGKAVAVGRRAERLEELREELGASLLPRAADVRDEPAIRALIADLPPEFAAIDILFNNAGLAAGLDKAQSSDFADWKTMIDTNVVGFATVTHALLPGMVARNHGHIVNLSSVAATYPYVGGAVYGGTKAFVRQFSLSLRSDLLGSALKVTSVEPGMCDTEFSTVRFSGDKAAADKVYQGMKALSADDVALTVESILRLPAHLNVNTIELMPVQQAFAGFAVDRG
jgi:3-hydroxy acid dehydrogenase / malonic semialdehyde reductase